MSKQPHESPVPFRVALGWALYLACSWTWCIGMFLPVLLMRDYGVWGYVVFAVPNVIGAAGMGWVLSGRHQPRELAERHRGAVRAFAVVTVAFQAYFLGVLINWTGIVQAGLGVLLVVVAGAVLGSRAARARLLAAAVFVLSVLCAIGAASGGAMGAPVGGGPPVDLLWLAPVCVFGFALCPYLDPTFLRAAEMTHGRGRRLAFGLGFGVFFLAMILLTLAYGGDIVRLETTVLRAETVRGLIFLHVGAQLTFTALLHLRELARMRPKRPGVWPFTVALAGGAFIGSWLLEYWPDLDSFGASFASPELYYRVFMAAYGLVFPAYVWVCMIPTRDGHSGLGGERGRRKMLVWLGAVSVAAPLFWMGLMELDEFFLVPGLLVVLLSRQLVRTRARG